MSNSTAKDRLVVSYLILRRAIGVLGMAFPFILILTGWLAYGCTDISNSISLFYHSDMRDVVVGILCAIGLFLLLYKGYEKDYIPSRIAGFCAIGIALFHTHIPNAYQTTACSITTFDTPSFMPILHVIFAFIFFLTLAYMSYFIFTKSDGNQPMTTQKVKRNRIYKIAGIIIVVCMLLILVYHQLVKNNTDLYQYKIAFWLETIMLVAFGLSWITKGEMIYKDVEG